MKPLTHQPVEERHRTRRWWQLSLAVLATALLAATLGGGIVSASTQPDECVVAAPTLAQAKADFATSCSEPRVDCDLLDATWYCSDRVIGSAAPGGVHGPPSTIDDAPPPSEPPSTTEPPPATQAPPIDAGACTESGSTLQQAKAAFEASCTTPRADCDPSSAGWTCSDEVIGDAAPATPVPAPTTTISPTTTEAPTTTAAPTTTTPPTTTAPPNECDANTSGQVDLAKDLISLHYDHAPDRDDGHATAAGKEVALKIGFQPWVIGGAYGSDNARTYRDASEPVMDAVWGSSNWVNADDDWQAAVQATANRWQATLDNCGDVWIAEGGQSDLSSDVVRELLARQPELNTAERIHLVQHSNWNEDQANNADLAYVRRSTDYIRIPDGNGRGNGTAGLNEQGYGNGPFVEAALNGPVATGWRAAFDYYPTSQRLDFSDTVELLEILGIGTNEVADIDEFIDRFMNRPTAPNPRPEGVHPDIVDVIDVKGRNPGGAGWADSYSVGDACYCITTFDHNIGGIVVDTPDGPKTVREVCDTIGDGPGAEGRPIYNDVQCGNGPPNDAGDEDDCPGRVDIGRQGCGHIGPKWDLSIFRQ